MVADSDLLYDGYYLSQQNLLGFTISNIFNDNLNFMLNTSEMLTGNPALISIRSRGTFERPFTRVQELERKAQDRWLDQGDTVTRYAEDGEVYWPLKGNGGINSTGEDLYRWCRALKSYQILPKPLFEKYTTAYSGADGISLGYGYGWGIRTTDQNTKRINHNGSNGSFSHSIIWRPEEDFVIIYATNASSPHVERVAYSLEKMVFDQNYQPDPIKKNVYFMIHDFLANHSVEKSDELLSILNNEYPSDMKNPNALNRMGLMALESEKSERWGLKLLGMNTQLFPDDGNLWDSLGEAYLRVGRLELAKTSFEKALALKPETDCHWCENAAKKLSELNGK